MMKKQIFRLPILALVLTGFFMLTACPIPEGGGGVLNTTALENKIAEAKAERDNTVVGTSDNDAPLGKYWVNASVMANFVAAIAAADVALHMAVSQSLVNTAVISLDNALNTFKNARRPGTATPVDTSALAAKIAEAENAKAAVVVDTAAANVATGMMWVTQQEMTVFETAITAAKTVRDTAINQTVVTNAVTTLTNATNTFINNRKAGAKNSGFSAQDLAALVETAKAIKVNVTVSANGNDVGPADSWVSQGALNTLNTAIANAESASGPNIDSQYTALVTAISSFNAAKSTGIVPDKSALMESLQNLISASENIVEAASAAQAPLGSQWATPAQWAALNAARSSALAVYGNANASQVMVTEANSNLSSAIMTFFQFVNANGPGMNQNQNSIRITGLESAHNGKMIQVYLFDTQDEYNTMFMEQRYPEVFGSEDITGNAVTVVLVDANNMNNPLPWTGTGSYFVGLMIADIANMGGMDDDPALSGIDFYISKTKVAFTTSTPNPTRTLNDFERYVFSTKLGDFLGNDIFNGNTMTLDALVLLMSDGEMDYATMVQESGMTLYKNKALTQPFTGSDVVGANTVVYSLFPLGGMSDSPGQPSSSLSAPTVTAAAISSDSIYLSWDHVPGASGYFIYRSDSYNGSYEYTGYTNDSNDYTDSGLFAGTTYYYRVSAYDYNNNDGPHSLPVSATTLD